MSDNPLKEIRLTKKRFYDIQYDLLNSKYHNFGNHLNQFIEFCELNPIMQIFTAPLKNDESIDIDEWWNNISRKEGYKLPSDPDQQASLLYKFLLGLNSGRFNFHTFSLNIYMHRTLDDNVYDFNQDITPKIVRYLNHKLNEVEAEVKVQRGELITKETRKQFTFLQILPILVTILITVGGIYGYAYHNRPIVDYMLGCDYEIGESVNVIESAIKIQIRIKNRGNIDCPMDLIITLRNATFQNINTEIYRKLTNNNRILIYSLRNQKRMDWWTYGVDIRPDQNVSYCDIKYELKKISSGNLITDILKRTAEVIPYDPIFVAFEQTAPSVYKRID